MKALTKKLAVFLSALWVLLSFSALKVNAVTLNLYIGDKKMILVDNGSILLSDDSDVAKTELSFGNVYYVYGIGEGSVTLYEIDNDFNIVSTYDVNVIGNDNKIVGDVNTDGIVNIEDVNSLGEYLVRKSNNYNFEFMDIDNDTNINVFDFIFLKRIVAYDIYPGQNTPQTTEPTETTASTTTTTTTTKVTTTKVTTTLSEKDQAKKYAEEVLELVNKERAAEGVSPLKLNEKLFEASMVRAEEITELFSHDRPDGTTCFTVLDDFGITYSYVGENIAAGNATPLSVVNSWMESPGHRANILSENFTELGVGYVYDPDSVYGYYWVQMFIRS